MVYVALSTGTRNRLYHRRKAFPGKLRRRKMRTYDYYARRGIDRRLRKSRVFYDYACGSYIVKHAVNAIESGIPSSLKDMVSDLSKSTAKHIAEAYKQGNYLAEKLMKQLIGYFSPAYLQSIYCVQYQLLCRRRPDQYGRLFPGKDPGGG